MKSQLEVYIRKRHDLEWYCESGEECILELIVLETTYEYHSYFQISEMESRTETKLV